MLIPKFWAEARAQHRGGDRRITVRRFGWSDENESAAQAMANGRAQEALSQALAGEDVLRFEPRRAYNGAEGVPIREEIVSQHGDTVITRNGYGALCLNTPNVMFVDIDDVEERLPETDSAIYGLAAFSLLVFSLWRGWLVIGVLSALAFVAVGIRDGRKRHAARSGPKPKERARARIADFVAANPGWRFRIYHTPAGMRALAMHRKFQPGEAEVLQCFAALAADPVYAKMCLNQQCFRARVSPKPWRVGIHNHIAPRSGAWPVPPEQQAGRKRWIADYDQAAQRHAACRYLETIGIGAEDPAVRSVQALHDNLCRATTPLPIA